MSGASAAMRLTASATVPALDNVVAVRLQRGLEKAQDRRLVIDDQHAAFRGHVRRLSAREDVSVKRVPRPLRTGLSARDRCRHAPP